MPKKIKRSMIVSILVNILAVYKIVQLSFGFFNIGYCRWSSELKVSHAMGDFTNIMEVWLSNLRALTN